MTVVLALALGGCSGGLAGLVTKAPPTAYNLTAPRDFGKRLHGPRGLMVVGEPIALGPYESERILVRPTATEAAQMAGAQWEDRLPKLVQSRLIESFENAGRLRTVGRPGDRISSDYTLATEIRAFEINATDGTAVVEIAAKIINEKAGRIGAARVIRTTVPVTATEGPAAIDALNEAFMQAARQIVLWVEKTI